MKAKNLVIIGGGAAGMAAAQYGARAALPVLVIEKMGAGGTLLLIDELENYPGNVAREGAPRRTGFEFAEDLRRQAEDFGARFKDGQARFIAREGENFRIELESGETLEAGAVILATGAARRQLGIPGEQELVGRGVSYCASCDGPFFRGKRIFVSGGGDSACDEARYLARLSSTVSIVHRRGIFRAQRALAERVLSDDRIEKILCTQVTAIKGTNKVEALELEDTRTGRRRLVEADALFIFVGSSPQSDLARSAGAALDAEGYILTNVEMETNITGLFAAGDVRASPFRQVVTAVADGAIAAHCAAAYLEA
jgi:thioredoxin reductase (NADPH)